MGLYQQIEESIEKEVNVYGTDVICITWCGENYISVADFTGDCPESYTITNPDSIDEKWLEDRVIVTASVGKLGLGIDTKKIAEWLISNVDKTMYMMLQNIVFVNDIAWDYDYLCAMNEDFCDMLEVNDLPSDGIVGYTWWNHQIVFVQVKSIVDIIDEEIASGNLFLHERDVEINKGILMTLVHEIRHIAQSNPWIPESVFGKYGEDSEEDAENYAVSIAEKGFPFVLEQTHG